MVTSRRGDRVNSARAVELKIKNFAHLEDVRLVLGDLTVLVGPHGAGKSLALQWLKVAIDGRQVVDALKAAGHRTEPSNVLIDLIFGTGMAPAWKDGATEVCLDRKPVSPRNISRIGSGQERLLFVPAQRSMLISDGWAYPFRRLNADTPAVARLFSQHLFDLFVGRNSSELFPDPGRLSREVVDRIDAAVFRGGKVGIKEDRHHVRRLRLVFGDVSLPFMAWTAGQREFAPLLFGLYQLLPSAQKRKREETGWVVIEEPEMGLQPQAITVVLWLILDLMQRGYRVVISTHSPHVLTMLWMVRQIKLNREGWRAACDGFNMSPSRQSQKVAEAALVKDYRAYLFHFNESGKVVSQDISEAATPHEALGESTLGLSYDT